MIFHHKIVAMHIHPSPLERWNQLFSLFACSFAFQVIEDFVVAIKGDLLKWCSHSHNMQKQKHHCPK